MASPKRRWVRVVLPLAAILLLGTGAFLLYWTGAGEQALRWLGQWASNLQGVQVLASQLGLDLETTTIEDKAMAWIQRGAALEEEGRYQEAVESYETALEIAPDQPVAYYGLASIYESLGQIDMALMQMEQAVEVAPDEASGYRQLGRLQCMNDQPEVCIQTLQQAVQMEPDNVWGHYFLATAYRQNSAGGYEKALAVYERVLEMDPELADAHLGMAYLYLNQSGKEVLALEAFQKGLDAALKAGDENVAATARAELAHLYYAQDNYTQCVEEWKAVLETDPDNAVAHRRLGLCYAMRRDEGDLEQAIAEMEQAMELSFGQMDAYYFYLGQYYATEQEYVRAVWAWEQFLRFSKNDELNTEVQKWIDQLTQ